MNELNSALLNLTRLALLALMTLAPGMVHADGGAVDTMSLTDEPGNWFRSQITGTPVTVIRTSQRVDFKINNCCTSTRHTVTLLMKPAGSHVVSVSSVWPSTLPIERATAKMIKNNAFMALKG